MKGMLRLNGSPQRDRTGEPTVSSAEMYRGWIIEARPVFCVQVWSAAGECVIPIHNAKTEEEALHLAKRWIDLQMTPDEARPQSSEPPPPDFDDDDIPF
jgi:hypothetical protein